MGALNKFSYLVFSYVCVVHVFLMQNAISLPAGLQVTPNMFFLRNDQGQVMLMTGQPQAVPGAGGEVRLQQPSGTAVFRVCELCYAFLTFLDLQRFPSLLCCVSTRNFPGLVHRISLHIHMYVYRPSNCCCFFFIRATVSA